MENGSLTEAKVNLLLTQAEALSLIGALTKVLKKSLDTDEEGQELPLMSIEGYIDDKLREVKLNASIFIV